ncbi:MAG: ATP-binding cassette domain-containing protein [Chthoniobacteraceae bacterium]
MSSIPLSVNGISIGGAPITFDLRQGEILAVLGDNGAGKSLLLAHLTGHLRTPKDAVRLSKRELGVVFQHHGLIRNLTVFENVALPFLVHALDLDGGLEQQVRLRLGLVGCADLAQEKVHGLSEGDKRCVALARALSGGTRLLIADEPAASLSPAKKTIVEQLLVCLVQTGVLDGIVLATQDLDFAQRIATHVLLLHDSGHMLAKSEDAAQDEFFKSFTGRVA